MNFSEALEELKLGKRVTRDGWNGKGMWLAYSPGSSNLHPDQIWSEVIRDWVRSSEGDGGHFRPYIMMKTIDDEFVPWVASHSDLLADDWRIRLS